MLCLQLSYISLLEMQTLTKHRITKSSTFIFSHLLPVSERRACDPHEEQTHSRVHVMQLDQITCAQT